MEQQCWWESEQAQQIAEGWTAEKQRRHDERQKQVGDRESDWKLLMQQLEQDGVSLRGPAPQRRRRRRREQGRLKRHAATFKS